MRVAMFAVIATACTVDDRVVEPSAVTDPPRSVQVDRPTGCAGDLQPAIVDFAATPTGRVPAWTCRAGCGPGLEYVARLTRTNDHLDADPACAPVCSADSHRVSYAVLDSARGEDSCAPGSDDPAQAAETRREQAAQIAVVLAPIEQRLVQSEATVARLAASTAWTDADLDAYNAIPRSWGGRGTRALIASRYGARIADVTAQVQSLWPRAQVAYKRRMTAEAEQARLTCIASCDHVRTTCRDACVGTTTSVCATCELEGDHCAARCK